MGLLLDLVIQDPTKGSASYKLYQTCLVFARERSLGDIVVFKDVLPSGHDWTDEVTFANVCPKFSARPYHESMSPYHGP